MDIENAVTLISISFPALSETSEIESTENIIELFEPWFTEEDQDLELGLINEAESFIIEENILALSDNHNSEVSRSKNQVLPIPEPLPMQGEAFKVLSPLAQTETISVPESTEKENTTETSETPETVPEEQAENQEIETESNAKSLAEAAQNLIANLISVPFQNNTSFGVGPWDRTQNIMNFQPVIPFDLNQDWLIVSRTILPVIYQPPLTVESANRFGFGDLNPQFFFVPKNNSKWTWGAGPVFLLPTATSNSLGTGKWGIGPTAVVVYTSAPWVIGALANNIWSVAGDSDRANVSQFLLQPFINYNLADGWYLVTAPIITANWMADSGNQWTIPIGGGFGKLFKIGKQPVNASLQGYWYAEKPKSGPDWTIRAQFQLLFPK
jgi:hypothetical protein